MLASKSQDIQNQPCQIGSEHVEIIWASYAAIHVSRPDKLTLCGRPRDFMRSQIDGNGSLFYLFDNFIGHYRPLSLQVELNALNKVF
jgi:hypothetical protein